MNDEALLLEVEFVGFIVVGFEVFSSMWPLWWSDRDSTNTTKEIRVSGPWLNFTGKRDICDSMSPHLQSNSKMTKQKLMEGMETVYIFRRLLFYHNYDRRRLLSLSL